MSESKHTPAPKWSRVKEYRSTGLFFALKRGEESIGYIGSSYSASNNGTAFARNHRPGLVSVWGSVQLPGKIECERVYEWRGTANSRNEADSVARKIIRENDVRGIVARAALAKAEAA